MAFSSTCLAAKVGAQWFMMAECMGPGSDVMLAFDPATIFMPVRARRLENGSYSSARRSSSLAFCLQRSPSCVLDSAWAA
eukprot:3932077-Pyramimonas_sp.AAC.1